MRIFNRTKTKELQLSDVNLELGQLVSSKLTTTDEQGNVNEEYVLIYVPSLGKVRNLIKSLKGKLGATDYKAIKFSEGELSVEEFYPIRLERREWRKQINELEAFLESETKSSVEF